MNKVAFLYPGQGSQYIGMGKWLYDNYIEAREVFEQASDALKFDLCELCFRGSKEELSKTQNTQPAVLAVGIAATKVLQKEFPIEPAFLAGHSLGEYTALTVAGALDFEDAIKLVRLRGKLMQEAVNGETGVMSAINGVESELVQAVCKEISGDTSVVEVSNYNSNEQIVIAGHREAVERVEEKLGRYGARVIRLKVSAPFHCSLMKPAADKMEEALSQIHYKKLNYPVISNVTAVPYVNETNMKKLLLAQMTRAVEWSKTMHFIYSNNIDLVIDLGPGEVVKNLWKRNYSNIKSFSFEKNLENIIHREESKNREGIHHGN